MATTTEIARKAGVSQSTASRVMNGDHSVSEEKRARVLEVLKELGMAVRESPKRRGRKTMIGFLQLDGSETEPAVIIRKQNALLKFLPEGWTLFLVRQGIHPLSLEASFLKGELHGLILTGYAGEHRNELVRALAKIPHVWLNSHNLGPGGTTVLMGNEFAGRMAADFLIRKQTKKPLVLAFRSGNPGLSPKVDGFRFRYFSLGLPCAVLEWKTPENRNFENCSAQELEKTSEELLPEVLRENYDGIFIPDERMATLFHRGLARRNRKDFPRLVACGSCPEYFSGLYPRPAVVNLNPELVAKLALEKLQSALQNDSMEENISVIVNPILIPGEEIP